MREPTGSITQADPGQIERALESAKQTMTGWGETVGEIKDGLSGKLGDIKDGFEEKRFFR